MKIVRVRLKKFLLTVIVVVAVCACAVYVLGFWLGIRQERAKARDLEVICGFSGCIGAIETLDDPTLAAYRCAYIDHNGYLVVDEGGQKWIFRRAVEKIGPSPGFIRFHSVSDVVQVQLHRRGYQQFRMGIDVEPFDPLRTGLAKQDPLFFLSFFH